jgi:hypothetical protein
MNSVRAILIIKSGPMLGSHTFQYANYSHLEEYPLKTGAYSLYRKN